jgi:hypothetical protein
MTKTTKIVLGVGVIALAYYLYTKRGKGSSTTTQTPSNTSLPPIINDFPTLPKGKPSDRQVECEKRLVEALKTMRPDNLQEFKSKFISDCQSKEAIQYDACRDSFANVKMTNYDLAIGKCMGCKSGEVYSINSSNGKVMCHKILKGYV